MTSKIKNPKCPKCKSANTALIIYGDTPDFDSSRLDRKISFGGCCIEIDSPKWECLDCKFLWGRFFSKKFDPKNYKKKNFHDQKLQKNRTKISKKQDEPVIPVLKWDPEYFHELLSIFGRPLGDKDVKIPKGNKKRKKLGP